MSDEVVVPEFKPWRADFVFGSILALVAALAITLATSGWPALAKLKTFLNVFAVLSSAAAFLYFRRGRARAHGVAVERKSIAQVRSRLRDGWDLHANVAISAGDLDALLEGPDGQRFSIEIKSQRNIKLAKGGWLSKARLLDHKGKTIAKDALGQSRRNAHEVDAVAVLWYPHARRQKPIKIDGVTVVCGNARDLLKAIKVPSKGWF